MSDFHNMHIRDGDGKVNLAGVNASGEVSVVNNALPLPSGASTEAKQDTQITNQGTINTNLNAIEANQTDGTQATRITDGSEILSINASNEATTHDADTLAKATDIETNQTDKSQYTKLTDGTDDVGVASSYTMGQLIDESGTAYGVKHISNKPRVSAMPYAWDIAECSIADHHPVNKFGHSSAVGSSEEEIWDGGTAYTYLTTADTIDVSGGATDTGNTLSSGTATGGSTTTLIDTGATFQTDTVAAGDLVINDTELVHGIVLTVDSEIQITVALPFRNGSPVVAAVPFENNDVYRVVNANAVGAAVVQIQGLNSSYVKTEEYMVLNGATEVASSKTYLRLFRAKVILAGSTGSNVAAIDFEDDSTSTLLARIIAAHGQTLMALWTVPADNTAFLTGFTATTSSSKATEVDLYVRPFGEAWQCKKKLTIFEGGAPVPFDFPLPITQRSDISVKASASGGGGDVSAWFDLWYES